MTTLSPPRIHIPWPELEAEHGQFIHRYATWVARKLKGVDSRDVYNDVLLHLAARTWKPEPGVNSWSGSQVDYSPGHVNQEIRTFCYKYLTRAERFEPVQSGAIGFSDFDRTDLTGQEPTSRKSADQLIEDNFPDLSPREKEVAHRLLTSFEQDGKRLRHKDLAAEMGVSARTMKGIMASLRKALAA